MLKCRSTFGGLGVPGRMDFEFRFGPSAARRGGRASHDSPFRILVMGDFRGAAEPAPAAPRPVKVDVDNFDAVMARLAPRYELPAGPGGTPEVLAFKSLDDFHPDALYAALEIFRSLRSTRAELLDPKRAPEAIARLTGGASAPPPPAPAPVRESDADALQRLLGRPASAGSAASVDIDALLRRVVAPHIVPEKDPRTDSMVRTVDQASEALMRALLRDPAFRALESAWRGLHALVTGEAAADNIEVHVLDAPRAALAADLLGNAAALERSQLFRAVMEQKSGAADGTPWALLVGAYAFGPGEDDLRLLAALGAIAHRAGGAFVAQAEPALVACESFARLPEPSSWPALAPDAAAAWQALRKSETARSIGLAAPRLLMRLPYGKRSDPVERFAFEEIAPDSPHEALPWGFAAFAIARLLALSFSENGFAMEPGDHRDLGELPAHVTERDGEKALTPCAETLLSETAAQALLERGLMPLVSFRNRAAVMVPRFQSIASPPAPLAGPWS
jgi:type VI secretion system protein ImpC